MVFRVQFSVMLYSKYFKSFPFCCRRFLLTVEFLGKLHPVYGPKDFLGAVLRIKDPAYISNPMLMGEEVEPLEEEEGVCEESLVGIINVKSLFTLVNAIRICMLDSFTNKPIVCIVVFCLFFLQKYCYGMYII